MNKEKFERENTLPPGRRPYCWKCKKYLSLINQEIWGCQAEDNERVDYCYKAFTTSDPVTTSSI